MIKLENIKLTISDDRKNIFWEVFTDILLIADMLKEVHIKWEDNNNKFYDPTCWNWYFLFFVYDILMWNWLNYKWYEHISGLKNVILSEEEREKHIIENMLYWTDIQENNIDFCKQIFKEWIYKTNFICSDYLIFDTKSNFWSINHIIWNPPFQAVMENWKRKAKNYNLWRPIILKSFNELEKWWLASFVCPSSWMSLSKANKKMFSLFLSNNVLNININECWKYFKGIGNNFSFFSIRKEDTKNDTKIITKYKKNIYNTSSKIDIPCLPLLITTESLSILKKVIFNNQDKKLNIKFDSELHAFTQKKFLSKIEDNIHKYKIFHTLNIVYFSSKPHKTNWKWKILIPISTYYDKLFINQEDWITQSMWYLICNSEEECIIIKKLLLSKLYKYIMNITRWWNWTSQDILYLLPDIVDKLPSEFNEENIFDYFWITEKEKKEILLLETN